MSTPYTEHFHETLKQGSRRSAKEIVPLILELIKPKSVVDVGCGLGSWLSVFKDLGIGECLGIDGDYVNTDRLEISQEEFQPFALDTPLKLGRTFDLVVSLEVAEHLPAESARTFIASLTDLGSVVLFSAAIPWQGGTNHVNEQWPDYWARLFQERDYLAIDCLRKNIWNNKNVEPWYAQNILVFVRRDCISSYPLLEKELHHTNIFELALIHPKINEYRSVQITDSQLLNARPTYPVLIEVTKPILDILPPLEVERLHCLVELEGVPLGSIELPVCDGLVTSYVLVDAIADEFAWVILEKFFQRTVYREIEVRNEPQGKSIWRVGSCLLERITDSDHGLSQLIHERAGWTIFLQELWGFPDWPQARFYEPQTEAPSTKRCTNGPWFSIDVVDDVPDLEVFSQGLHVILTVGGSAIGVVTVPVTDNRVSASMLRSILTKAGGFELCRIAVREGLIGRPLDERGSLKTRLINAMSVQQFVHGPAPTLSHALSPAQRGAVLGRRTNGLIGTTVSRRAALPAAVTQDLVDAAYAAGEPVLQVGGPGEGPAKLVYAPDLILQPLQNMKSPSTDASASRVARAPVVPSYDRGYFEMLFATQPDPWRQISPYQKARNEQILGLIPPIGIEQALEVGCAEGHFTEQLAPRVGSLIAVDISQIALDRATEHCAGVKNVQFVRLDLTKDPLPGLYHLIVCGEVLSYINGREALQPIALKMAEALMPNGFLLTEHTNLVADEPDKRGFEGDLQLGAKSIGEILAGTCLLRLVKELRTPLYRIQLFQRSIPEVIELTQSTAAPPDVASNIAKPGVFSRRKGAIQATVTDRLPILKYGRVAPISTSVSAGYQVSQKLFEDQIKYLHDAGFYSVSLEDWRAAKKVKLPLPGRAVLLTFDGCYLDFLTHAWPLLRHYGFSALVFLVTNEIGESNAWDRVSGEEIPLLGWDEIRQLRKEGVEFGSLSVSHRPLTSLSISEIVLEGSRSRAMLERGLGEPIQAFAYPYGDHDPVVRHLIGACGYIFGLSSRTGFDTFENHLLNLPRIEVTGSDRFQDYIAKLSFFNRSGLR
jgi:peptidoglycan/xylan/chitin deacetylase (PgdA/CDA1 family)/2-polyprenyl-3-methyl-5-hydroxy-6-metoxy-1,4-benzoquinol methylase